MSPLKTLCYLRELERARARLHPDTDNVTRDTLTRLAQALSDDVAAKLKPKRRR